MEVFDWKNIPLCRRCGKKNCVYGELVCMKRGCRKRKKRLGYWTVCNSKDCYYSYMALTGPPILQGFCDKECETTGNRIQLF